MKIAQVLAIIPMQTKMAHSLIKLREPLCLATATDLEGSYTTSYIAFTALEPIQAFGLERRGNYLEGSTKLQLNQSCT